MTIINQSAGTIRNYPLQFGRPFLKGAIPHAPRVLLNGHPIRTQADVKNRYPDGSVEFAVIAVVIPDMQRRASQVLTFEDTTSNSNTPLSAEQMLDPSFDFDSTIALTVPRVGATLAGAVLTTNPLWSDSNGPSPSDVAKITNGGLTVTANGHVCNITGLNFSGDTTWVQIAKTLTRPLSTCAHAAVNWYNASPRESEMGLTVASGTIGYASAPARGTDLSAFFNLTKAAGARLLPAKPPVTATADARKMLKNGDYKLWTSGPVAQTIILADNTPTRKYDLGFGDGYHPFRPSFEATFWPATHQVFVRAIGENDLSTELEDLSYALTITGGQTAPATEDTYPSVAQGSMATWTQEFWLGGTPQAQTNINNNLAYLESTRYVPNYDTSVASLASASVAAHYTEWWNSSALSIGGDAGWTPGMPTTGARADIGPNPSWDALWLYTGDWRMRDVSLADADRAAWWQVNTRETDTTERLLTSDPVPVAPAVGTGYGHPVSITDRVQLGDSAQGVGGFIYNNSGDPNPPNKLDVVGPLNTSSPNGWTFDVAHMPQPFFVPYILTGDPFYLGEMENWAAYVMATEQGQYAHGDSSGRGPTGAEGGLFYELRGDGWGLLQRAEAAFAEPDGTPEKTWLTEETNSDIARWDGALGDTTSVFAGTPEYVWAQQTGDPESMSGNSAPPLGNWEDSLNVGLDGGGQYAAGLVDRGSTNQWMQWYVQYAIGRIHNLGFADGPLVEHSGAYLTNEINISGYPELTADYNIPTSFTVGGMITTWPQMVSDLSQPWLTGVGWAAFCANDCTVTGALPTWFASDLQSSQGYSAYSQAALAVTVDEGAPGAVQAETWMKPNVHDVLVSEGDTFGGITDPSWMIVPRTDTNVLPAMPTTQP